MPYDLKTNQIISKNKLRLIQLLSTPQKAIKYIKGLIFKVDNSILDINEMISKSKRRPAYSAGMWTRKVTSQDWLVSYGNFNLVSEILEQNKDDSLIIKMKNNLNELKKIRQELNNLSNEITKRVNEETPRRLIVIGLSIIVSAIVALIVYNKLKEIFQKKESGVKTTLH